MYDGVQTNWVKEEIDLSDYLGSMIKVRFLLYADQGVNEDGFYFDDFQINVDGGSVGISIEDIQNWTIYPNPGDDMIYANTQNYKGLINIEIIDQFGRVVKKNSNTKYISVIELSSGIYYLRISSVQQERIFKFVKK